MMMPSRKVSVGLIAGAIVAVVMWLLKEFAMVIVPAEVGVALSTIISAIISYFVPDALEE